MILAIVVSHEWAETIRYVLAVTIPILVGLITKSTASSGLKSTLNVVLAAFVTAVTTVLDHADAVLAQVIREFIFTAVSSFATYYGVWKPTGIAGSVAGIAPKFGIGSPPDVETTMKGLEDLQAPPAVVEEVGEALAAEEEGDAEPPKKVAKKKAPAKKAAAKKKAGG